MTRIFIGTQQITLSLDRRALEAIGRGAPAQEPHVEILATLYFDDTLVTTISSPIRVGWRGRETRIILLIGQSEQRPADRSIATMIARGYSWRHQIATGEVHSALNIAKREKLVASYVNRIITLGFMAPDIITAILDGTAPAELTTTGRRPFMIFRSTNQASGRQWCLRKHRQEPLTLVIIVHMTDKDAPTHVVLRSLAT